MVVRADGEPELLDPREEARTRNLPPLSPLIRRERRQGQPSDLEESSQFCQTVRSEQLGWCSARGGVRTADVRVALRPRTAPRVERRERTTVAGVAVRRRRRFHPGAFVVDSGYPTETMHLIRKGQAHRYVLAETFGRPPPRFCAIVNWFRSRRCSVGRISGLCQGADAKRGLGISPGCLPSDRPRDSALPELVFGVLAQGCSCRWRCAAISQCSRRWSERLCDSEIQLTAYIRGDAPLVSRVSLAAFVTARLETLSRILPKDRRPREGEQTKGLAQTDGRDARVCRAADLVLAAASQTVPIGAPPVTALAGRCVSTRIPGGGA